MTFLYIGMYMFVLALVWGFFVIAKFHAYKFAHFSSNISLVTNILMIFLAILSLLGFILIFFLDAPRTTVKLQDISNLEENYY